MNDPIIVAIIIFLAVFTQSFSGFGFALVAMAWLPGLIGIHQATPLVALVMVTIEVFLLFYYRQAFNMRAVWRIVIASLMGIPFGIIFLSRVDQTISMTILGVVIIIYALYALLDSFTNRIHLPDLDNPTWAYGFGLIAGMLGGAYNTSGPPVIIYGNCRRWNTMEFKSNLQGFFVISSIAIVIGHAWNRNITNDIWAYFLWSIPAMAVGIVAGTSLDRYLNSEIFHKIVLIMLVFLGVRLIFL